MGGIRGSEVEDVPRLLPPRSEPATHHLPRVPIPSIGGKSHDRVEVDRERQRGLQTPSRCTAMRRRLRGSVPAQNPRSGRRRERLIPDRNVDVDHARVDADVRRSFRSYHTLRNLDPRYLGVAVQFIRIG